ncbi:hypothetical protein [Maricaulis maris]|uniref:hypothetical protein n=1 Tax=Maricaulis maris TaxID=74318 RepID=UPI003A90A4B9
MIDQIVASPSSTTSSAPLAFAIGSAMAAAPLAWPTMDATGYEIMTPSPSYSGVSASPLATANIDTDTRLTGAVSNLYSTLLEFRQNLGPEFERIWDENEARLYEW